MKNSISKRWGALALAALLAAGILSGCTREAGESGGTQTLKVAALESAYGRAMWEKVAAAFEKANDGVTVELTVDKNLEDVISPEMKAGDYPDVVHLAVGRTAALTETLTKDNALRDLSGVLDMTVPGEDVTVREKIVPGFLDTLVTNPYSDGKTYLAHTLNNTCVAPPRMLIALLENNLQADGTVKVPKVLQPYMGGKELLVPTKK